MAVIAVVPILTSAGAAALPTILAALASVVAIMFKPREFLRLARRRPLAVGCSMAVVALGVMFALRLIGDRSARAVARPTSQSASRYDWAQVAEQIIARKQLGDTEKTATPRDQNNTKIEPRPAPVEQKTSQSESPLVLGRDFSRSHFDGGTSPVGLQSLWAFRPEETMFLSAPAVSEKRIFAAGCQVDLAAYTGLLACLDAETGKPLWQVTQLGDEPLRAFFSSPAVTSDGKSLLIGQGLHEDRDCSLLCFDAATGQRRWAVKTSLHIESSPAIFGDLVVVGAGAIEGRDGKPTGDPGYVLAVRISDGQEQWRQAVDDPESSPAIDNDGIVYIGSGFNGNAVVALRSDSVESLHERKLDRVLWRTDVSQPVTGPIALTGEVVIAGAGNGDVVHSHAIAQGLVVALERKSGEVRWRTPLNDAVLGGVACRDGTLICPVRTGEVIALDAKDGHALWRTKISGAAPVLAGCAFSGPRVYAVSSDGYLAVLDVKDGHVLEKSYLNDQGKPGAGLSLSAPQIVGGRIIVGSETGGLHCLVGSRSPE